MLKRALTIAVAALTLAVTPVCAQDGGTSRPIEGAPAPFDADLVRLAEILGSLHYLRALCGANEGSKWRDQMQALLDAETQSGDRRRRLVTSFNRGYRVFQQTYRTCTPAADLAVRRYLDEGAKISREITARYQN
ncbi:MAG: TIGR02301 family protein [Alphaproteobacteria bacterium]|nr:TIGR02301 family protein [Alphaproteobacteria bacterium]